MTNSCQALQVLHAEQPAILQPEEVPEWLDVSHHGWTEAHSSAILEPYDIQSTPLEWYEVENPHLPGKDRDPKTIEPSPLRQMGIREAFKGQAFRRSQPQRAEGSSAGQQRLSEPRTPTKNVRGSHRTPVKHIPLTPRSRRKGVSASLSSSKGKQREVAILICSSSSESEDLDELPEPITTAGSRKGKARAVAASPIIISSDDEVDDGTIATSPPSSREVTPLASPERPETSHASSTRKAVGRSAKRSGK
ncbi:hypothetical protein H1R20_g15963, partial [Candolleomyces eurysporus]